MNTHMLYCVSVHYHQCLKAYNLNLIAQSTQPNEHVTVYPFVCHRQVRGSELLLVTCVAVLPAYAWLANHEVNLYMEKPALTEKCSKKFNCKIMTSVTR